jgi:hypothetical protein
MRVAKETWDDIVKALAAVFLLNSALTRDAERVTAEEVRRLAEELEQSLGGVYSVLSQEFQLKIATRVDANLVSRGVLEKLPADAVQATIVTGLAALARGQDLQRLNDGLNLVGSAEQVVPGTARKIDGDNLVERIFIGVGVDTDGLFKSEEDIQAEEQQAQQMALAAKGLEGAAPAAGKAAVESAMGGAGAPPVQ